jgi:hypothetical protein
MHHVGQENLPFVGRRVGPEAKSSGSELWKWYALPQCYRQEDNAMPWATHGAGVAGSRSPDSEEN